VLAPIETRRALHRARLEGELDDESVATLLFRLQELEQTLNIIALDPPLQEVAGAPLPVLVRTLDAIHLATSLAVRAQRPALAFATHDRRLATAARSLGFEVVGG
jgi:predicted nucleic acid-binding protein